VIELKRPRDVSALFRDSLVIYGRHFGTFLALAAVVVAPVVLIVQGIGLEQLTADYDDSPSVAETVVPAVVDFLVIAPLVTAICIHALHSIAGGGSPGAGEAIVRGFEAFTPLFFAVVLVAIGVAAGLLVFVVPGVYLFVRWFFVPQVVVIEGLRAPAALQRGGELVTGIWWRTFGLIVLVNLAAALPALLLTTPFAGIASSTDRAVWSLVGTIVTATVTGPFVAIYATLLYYDLRARKGI
jgi:hypothetical protein